MIVRVKLLEYEAKSLLKQQGFPIPKSYLANSSPDFLPIVLKSQVPTGGRGKAGGVVIVQTQKDYESARQKILSISINGFLPKKLLAEELLDIKQELYLSLLIDKPTGSFVIMASAHGGVEVEEQHDFEQWHFTHQNFDAESLGQSLADFYNLPDKTFLIQDLIEKLYTCLTKNDALLIEINPLVVTEDNEIIAGDCKMEIDDAALYRHSDWDFEAEKSDVNFVTLNQKGDVATIANGAGLAMATVDAVADAGLTPANFLDIGGGANEASVLAAFQRLMEYPNIKVIIINIFAGITRCDEVAKAIIAAREQLPNLPPLTVRLAGTNYEEAVDILKTHGVGIESSLADAILAAKKEVRS